jgi:integrase
MTAASASKGNYIFTMEDGGPFVFGWYRKNIWNPALQGAELTNKVPYSARHSLVQWSLVVGVTPVRLVEIMGHRDKQMIFGVYGRYRQGLVEERQAILNYLGEDFLKPEKAAALEPHSETYSETQGPETAKSLTAVGF